MNKFLASRATSRLFSINNKNQSAAASVIITRSYGGRSAATHQLLVRFIGLLDQNSWNYKRFQQFSTGTTKVWFQLVTTGEEELSSTSVILKDDDVIDELKRAVKIEIGPLLDRVSAVQLKVYPPGTTIPVPADIKPCPVVTKVNEHSTKGYIVVAPSQQMNADVYGLNDTSKVLLHRNVITAITSASDWLENVGRTLILFYSEMRSPSFLFSSVQRLRRNISFQVGGKINHDVRIYDTSKLVRPDQVVVPTVTGPPFVAPENWLEDTGNTILRLFNAEDGEIRVPPMALIRCSRGGKTRALYEIANWLKTNSTGVAIIYVSFNNFSGLRPWEQDDPTGALCRRIAYAAMKGRNFSNSQGPSSREQYNGFEYADVSSDDIKEWLGKTPCVLLIDELNMLKAMGEKGRPEAKQLSAFLKYTFLDSKYHYFVFSSHLVSTTYELSACMDSFSQRKLEVRQLPLIPSVKVAEVLLRFPKLNARQALFYGLIPALIYEAGGGETVSQNAKVAMQTWIRAGIDTEEVLALLASFLDGKSTNVPRCVLSC